MKKTPLDRMLLPSRTNKTLFQKDRKQSLKKRPLRVERTCEVCGKTFSSYSCVARYCSKRCNNKAYYASQQKELAEKVKQKHDSLKKMASSHLQSDLLTIKDFAEKIGVCKQTVYTLAKKGHVRIIRFSQRLSYIRWSEFIDSINSCEENEPTRTVPEHESSTISLHRSVQEAERQCTDRDAKESPTEEWLSATAASKHYKISRLSFITYASKYRINKKTFGGEILYSVSQMDEKRGYNKAIPDGYISIKAAAQKYHLEASNISNKLSSYHIKKFRKGRIVYFPESDFLDILSKRRTG